MKNKIVLLTGATGALGTALAHAYAQRGAHLILLAKDKKKLTALDDALRAYVQAPPTLVPLDLSKLDELEQLGPSLYERFGRIDVLVGNAAVLGCLGPIAHFDKKKWDQVFTVNFTSQIRLLQNCAPLLGQSPAGRAIFVTCNQMGAYWGAYAASKAALSTAIQAYQLETQTHTTKAHLIDPGVFSSKIRTQAFPGEAPGLYPIKADVVEEFMRLSV